MTDTLPQPIRLAIEAEKLANAYAACWPVDTQVKADTILGCASALRSTNSEAEALRARVAELEAKLAEANEWLVAHMEGGAETAQHFGELMLKKDAHIAELEAKLADAGKDADGYLIDAVAWEGFIRDYRRYVDGDSSMPFTTLRDSLSAVVHSAVAIAAKEQPHG